MVLMFLLNYTTDYNMNRNNQGDNCSVDGKVKVGIRKREFFLKERCAKFLGK